MGFKMICEKCGTVQRFEEGDTSLGDNVEVEAYERHSFQGSMVESIDIYCNNSKCNHYISIM